MEIYSNMAELAFVHMEAYGTRRGKRGSGATNADCPGDEVFAQFGFVVLEDLPEFERGCVRPQRDQRLPSIAAERMAEEFRVSLSFHAAGF